MYAVFYGLNFDQICLFINLSMYSPFLTVGMESSVEIKINPNHKLIKKVELLMCIIVRVLGWSGL